MAHLHERRVVAVAAMALVLLSGCRSAAHRALEQAKVHAAATHTAQRVQYIDKKGNTVTTLVRPATGGEPEEVTVSITPPAPGPVPHRTKPVITPVNEPVSGLVGGQVTGLVLAPGTEFAVRIGQRIGWKTSHARDPFSGLFATAVMNQGSVLIPAGTVVSGRLEPSRRRPRFRSKAVLELRLTAMTLNGYEYGLDALDLAGNRDSDIPGAAVVRFRLVNPLVLQHP